ncbi:acid phosphatase precursor [Ophiostoma piceae UAMH 11346]|uniref:Acid phosphatase n=1 Tax=Ophiostoma piceae (strain UAMH 11346) TaxID=1262450 RepID=S3BTQ4_OPHP1|nr:acid phosphatase precursor [Ophiostoma piceae UAMH 11346]
MISTDLAPSVLVSRLGIPYSLSQSFPVATSPILPTLGSSSRTSTSAASSRSFRLSHCYFDSINTTYSMRLLSLFAMAASARGLNILITNDDGFGTANIREMYREMTALGHNCFIVASSSDQSGQGAHLIFADSATLDADSEFGIIKAGAPSLGTDPDDDHIWYYNGSPATQVLVALDYVLPTYAGFSTPDLIMTGPNYGLNVGPFLYSISGTLGATMTALERGIPAIAFAAVYGTHTPYYSVNETTAAGLQDPATITGRLAAALAQALITKYASSTSNTSNTSSNRVLPLGYGLSVNIPLITSFASSDCVNPPFVLARMTGGGEFTSKAVYDNATGLFSSANFADAGTNMCINGDCSLPGEIEVINSGCKSSVVVFTTDYDAPYSNLGGSVVDPYALLPSLVQLNNATALVGGLGSNASVKGTSSTTSSVATATATSLPRSEGERQKQVDAMSSLALVIGVAAVLTLL